MTIEQLLEGNKKEQYLGYIGTLDNERLYASLFYGSVQIRDEDDYICAEIDLPTNDDEFYYCPSAYKDIAKMVMFFLSGV